MRRQCALCHRTIGGCFGFVRAKYFLLYEKGKTKKIKELCGTCVEKVLRRYFKVLKGELF